MSADKKSSAVNVNKRLTALLKKSKQSEKKKALELKTESPSDRALRYLQYEINYGKYKGKTWEYLYSSDYGYFAWALKRLAEFNPDSKTVEALSTLLRE